MSRPSTLYQGKTLYWTIRIRNPDTMLLKNADATPTAAFRRNGVSTGESATVTKRVGTTGIYDCSYTPATANEGDLFTVEEEATVTGTTTPQALYSNSWEFTVSASEGGQGTGARIVNITVRDSGAVPIQGASVRVSRAGETFVGVTNASGVVVFSLDDATWTVSITANGYSFVPVSLVVAGTVSQVYTMTTAGGGITPSTPPMTTGYWVVYNELGQVQSGAQVTLVASSAPVGSTGVVMDDNPRTATADANGVVQFSNLIRGATYIAYRTGSNRKFNVLVPVNAGTTVALGSIVG